MADVTPQTIQILLPGGVPRGIRVAEITTRIIQVTEVPRKLLPEFAAMPESEQVALYFLFGDLEDGERGVYVGQTGNPRNRLKQHHQDTNKDFWDRALVVTSRTQDLTQTHVALLEWWAIERATKVDRFKVVNNNAGSEPFTPASMRADCDDAFGTASTLLTTLGYPIFKPLVETPLPIDDPDDQVFVCFKAKADAKGRYTSEGMVVLAGSSGPAELTLSGEQGGCRAKRDRLIQAGKAAYQGDRFRFLQDTLFQSPSGAGYVVKECSSNGWNDWTTPDGRTKNAVIRENDPS